MDPRIADYGDYFTYVQSKIVARLPKPIEPAEDNDNHEYELRQEIENERYDSQKYESDRLQSILDK